MGKGQVSESEGSGNSVCRGVKGWEKGKPKETDQDELSF